MLFSSVGAASLLAASASAYWLPENVKDVKTCVVAKNADGADDTPNIVASVANCGERSRVVFKAGVTYRLRTPLQLEDLANVELVFHGNLSLPANVSYIESVTNNSTLYPGHWITISGTDVTLTGSTDPSKGWFLGHGDLWWTAGAAGSDNDARPHFFKFDVTNLRARNIKVLKPIAWVFSLGGSHAWMTDTFVDARSTDGFPFNTDGIDMSASNSLIDGFTIYSGDDMINISPPTTNVTVRNVYASGGHGLSVSCADGAGGDYLFEDSVVEDSLFGARFKGSLGTTCNLTDVAWRNITVRNTSYPIHFIENYVDQEKGAAGLDASVAAFAHKFSWTDIRGRTAQGLSDGSCITDPCWSATVGESNAKAVYLLCKDAAHCKGFHFEGIDLEGYSGKPAEMECTGLQGDTTLGIACTNGTIKATGSSKSHGLPAGAWP